MSFEMYRDKKGEWRWRLRATNHKIMADSGEGYDNENDCRHAIEAVRGGAAMAVVKTVDG